MVVSQNVSVTATTFRETALVLLSTEKLVTQERKSCPAQGRVSLPTGLRRCQQGVATGDLAFARALGVKTLCIDTPVKHQNQLILIGN